MSCPICGSGGHGTGNCPVLVAEESVKELVEIRRLLERIVERLDSIQRAGIAR